MRGESIYRARDSYHRELVERAARAIALLLEGGERVSFYAVAKRSGIARSTLYRCDDLRALVEEAREYAVKPAYRKPIIERSRMDGLRAELRHVETERDVLIEALNAVCNNDDPRPCQFALVYFEDEAA